jgi:hypothetical protein
MALLILGEAVEDFQHGINDRLAKCIRSGGDLFVAVIPAARQRFPPSSATIAFARSIAHCARSLRFSIVTVSIVVTSFTVPWQCELSRIEAMEAGNEPIPAELETWLEALAYIHTQMPPLRTLRGRQSEA